MDLSTLIALTWVALIAAAALTGLAKTAVPGLASIAATLFALVPPVKESTGVMFVFLPIADVIALWAYRHDANTAVLRCLVPSVLAGVGLGALLLTVSTQAPMRRTIGAILLPLIGALAPIVLTCAWAGRHLAAHIPLHIFEPLIIATTIVTTVPLLVQAWESVRSL